MLNWEEHCQGAYGLLITHDGISKYIALYDRKTFYNEDYEELSEARFEVSYISYNGTVYSHHPLKAKNLEEAQAEAIKVLIDDYSEGTKYYQKRTKDCNKMIALLRNHNLKEYLKEYSEGAKYFHGRTEECKKTAEILQSHN